MLGVYWNQDKKKRRLIQFLIDARLLVKQRYCWCNDYQPRVWPSAAMVRILPMPKTRDDGGRWPSIAFVVNPGAISTFLHEHEFGVSSGNIRLNLGETHDGKTTIVYSVEFLCIHRSTGTLHHAMDYHYTMFLSNPIDFFNSSRCY